MKSSQLIMPAVAKGTAPSTVSELHKSSGGGKLSNCKRNSQPQWHRSTDASRRILHMCSKGRLRVRSKRLAMLRRGNSPCFHLRILIIVDR